jgi:hypothetical protein
MRLLPPSSGNYENICQLSKLRTSGPDHLTVPRRKVPITPIAVTVTIMAHRKLSASAAVLPGGTLEIVDTRDGERIRFTTLKQPAPNLQATVVIYRDGRDIEKLPLKQVAGTNSFLSAVAPAEPHIFEAELELSRGSEFEALSCAMHEPHDHHRGACP